MGKIHSKNLELDHPIELIESNSIVTTNTGKNSQSSNNKITIKNQIRSAILLPITFAKRTKKLTILPCQSFCPNIGTNIFLSHNIGTKFLLPTANKWRQNLNALMVPLEYHQIGV